MQSRLITCTAAAVASAWYRTKARVTAAEMLWITMTGPGEYRSGGTVFTRDSEVSEQRRRYTPIQRAAITRPRMATMPRSATVHG
jgi:hypothetical protein